MLRPYRERVGVMSGDRARELVVVDLSKAMDDEDEE